MKRLSKEQIDELVASISEDEVVEIDVADMPLPNVFYDGRSFHVPTTSGGWVAADRASARQFVIRALSLRDKRKPGELQSPLDQMIVRIQTEHDVSYVGPLAGYDSGLYSMSHKRILVSSSPRFLEPKPGDFPVMQQLLNNLLGTEQLLYLYGWLKVALRMFTLRIWQPGQALVLCGPVGAGKNLLRKLITEILGGRVAFPHAWMTGRTNFDSELFGAETLAIEDQQESIDIRARRAFGAKIKDITVNEELRSEKKNFEAITLSPLRRLMVSMNDDPERMLAVPPLDGDIADKIILLQIARHPMPMPTGTPELKKVFWDTLVSELPMFVNFLNGWEIPAELQSERFGIKEYHAPDLAEALYNSTPEARLLEMIETELLPRTEGHPWEGSAAELEEELCGRDGPVGLQARKLFGHTNSCGTYLGRLCKQMPDRVSQRKSKGRVVWTVARYGGFVDWDESYETKEEELKRKLREEQEAIKRRRRRAARSRY